MYPCEVPENRRVMVTFPPLVLVDTPGVELSPLDTFHMREKRPSRLLPQVTRHKPQAPSRVLQPTRNEARNPQTTNSKSTLRNGGALKEQL